MYPEDTPVSPVQNGSKRPLIVGIAVAVTILVVAIVVTVLVLNGTKKTEMASQATPTPSAAPTVATNEDVKQSLTVLDETIKQAATDQATAKSALKDGTNQIKVAN